MALGVDRLACIRGERQLFSDLTFRLAPGEALLLHGPNGSGKSSLLRMLAGFLAPAAGRIVWDGTVPDDEEADGLRGRFCYLGHQDAVKPQLSARDNLVFWARLSGLAAERAEAAADQALDAAGLQRQKRLPSRYLSAGQKRRVALARLLLTDVPLWLLDEPSNALDRAAVDWLGGILAQHRAKGGMVVLASHVPVPLPDARLLELPDGRLT
ncbi:MAG TPA: heme ABC exporter ATP-binding protein CcmA [Ferrovibrio sp.]|jgi:heme exporter protein A|uniref:heme ABC exporter ATP-binding protein CcmA n=1 Tax=Ferrovibrio sp. TaxID=1917215 RepID=UPI002B4AF24D|nr:heme ABC exporter ATP-binding protein CcmA [Ferrovibrio sp.]HLT78485.1 heme ABC exporter ATP-binding protein CcmA [Ferrovibrio sp.]